MSKKIVIEFLGDSKDLQNAMGDADNKSSKLSGSLKKVGKAAAVGLAAGAAVGAVALVKMTQSAAEDEAAQAKLETQLKNSAGASDKQVASVEKWISAQGKALGVTDDELRPALSKLVTATGDVGEAQKLAALAMDISAGSGKSLESVSTALMKAQNGELAGLSKLGIETKNAAGETMSFEQATKKMADTFEGQAATKAETLQGKMDRLKLILGEAGEEIGAKLIPMVTEMADWFMNKGLPAIQAFGGWLSDHFPPIFDKIKEIVSKVMGGVDGDVSGNLGKVQETFQSVTDVVLLLWDKFGSTMVDYITKSLANVMQVVGGVLTVIRGIFDTFSALLKGDWQGVWDGIKTILSGALDIIKGIVKQAMNILGTVFEVAWGLLKTIVGNVWDGIKNIVSNGIGKLVEFFQALPGKFTGALASLGPTLAGLFRDAMDAGKDKVVAIGGTILEWIGGIPGRLLDKLQSFKNAGASLIGGFVDGMKNAAGVIEGIASNVWDAVRGLLNGAINKINAALEFTISIPGKDISINAPDIPQMAKGGIVNRPTLALIGEDGPEAVVPLSRKHNPGGVMPGMGGGGGAPIVVQLVLPSGKVIEQLLIQHTRNSGRPLQVSTLGPG